MFGKKKKEQRSEGENSRYAAQGHGGYYRQQDYYAQHPDGARYYDSRNYEEANARRDYARPGYDQRYVGGDGARPGAGYQPGRTYDGADRSGDGYSRYEGKEDTQRYRAGTPYMETGYGERVYERSYGSNPRRHREDRAARPSASAGEP